MVAHGDVQVLQDAHALGQAGGGAVVQVDAAGQILAVPLLIAQVGGDGQGGAAGADDAHLRAGLKPVALGHEGVQGQAGGDGVLGVGAELAVQLGDGGQLPEALGIGVQVVEHILCGVIHVNFVCGHQRAQGQGVIPEELHHRPVVLGGGVDGQVDALDLRVQPQLLGPDGEHFHDGGLSGGDAHKVHGGPFGGFGEFDHGQAHPFLTDLVLKYRSAGEEPPAIEHGEIRKGSGGKPTASSRGRKRSSR